MQAVDSLLIMINSISLSGTIGKTSAELDVLPQCKNSYFLGRKRVAFVRSMYAPDDGAQHSPLGERQPTIELSL